MGKTMKLKFLSLLFVSFLLIFSIANIAASSDDDFYPGDDGSVDDGFYPGDDGGSGTDDDFYPPADDDGGSGGDGGVGVSNNPPMITSFSVPATAYRNTDITLTVAATDSDGGVNRIEILKDNVVVASESCGNIISCTKSFILRVPNAFNAVYTFVARVFDNLGYSSTSTASGITNPTDFVTSPEPDAENLLDKVRVNIDSENLFVTSMVPDSACLAPGAETFLYVSINNRGKKTLDDVKVSAIVEELGIRAVSGPFTIKKGYSASRFLYFDVPETAKSGDYYVRVSVTSKKDSVVKYRIFELNKAC